jgi:PEP-CTERM motif
MISCDHFFSSVLRHSAFKAALALPFVVGLAAAESFTFVPITQADDNIQTALVSTVPNGDFTANNVLATPFDIVGNGSTNCGPAANAACNFYDGFGFNGSGQSITLNVSVADATNVYTLMNAFDPASGQTLATVQFIGTGGANETFDLVGGEVIRDFFQGSFTNSLTNGIAGINALNAFTCVDPTNCLGAGGTGNVQTGLTGTYVIDEQDFSLGSAFAGQTLTQIVITDDFNGSNPILEGVTVGSETASTAPEPASVLLLAGGLAGLGLVRRARRA